jgi:hypothetical protein
MRFIILLFSVLFPVIVGGFTLTTLAEPIHNEGDDFLPQNIDFIENISYGRTISGSVVNASALSINHAQMRVAFYNSHSHYIGSSIIAFNRLQPMEERYFEAVGISAEATSFIITSIRTY